jgi:hypothetical protein
MAMGLLNAVDLMAEKIAKKRGLNAQQPQLVQPQQNRMVPIVENRPAPMEQIMPNSTMVSRMPRNSTMNQQLYNAQLPGNPNEIISPAYPVEEKMYNAGQISAPIYEVDTSRMRQSPPSNIQREVVYPGQQINSLGSNGGVIDKIQSDDRFSFSSQDSLGLKRNGTVQFKGTDTGVDPVQLDKNQQRLSQGYGSQKHYENTFGNAEFMLALAMGFNNLSTFPNAQWGQFLQGQMKDISTQKKATNNANWFVSRGREDLAEAVFNGLPMEQALAEYNKKPDETFRELTAEEYKAMGHDPLVKGRIQVSETTGKKYDFGSKTPQTNLTVNTGDPATSFGKEIGKLGATEFVELQKNAMKAPRAIASMSAITEALVDPTIFETGPGAELGVTISKIKEFARRSAGAFFDADGTFRPTTKDGKKITEAALINAALGSSVFGAIGELGIGARGLDTVAERQFLQEVLAGTIEMTPATLLYMSYLKQKVLKAQMEDYNTKFDNPKIAEDAAKAGFSRVEIPDMPLPDFQSLSDAEKYLEEQRRARGFYQVRPNSDAEDDSETFIDEDGIEYDIEVVE